MAMNAWTADAITLVSDDLKFASQKFAELAEMMRSSHLEPLHLQADAAFGVYLSTLVKLAGTAESEFRDQLRCKKTGEVPRWVKNQKSIFQRSAKKKAVAAAEQLNLCGPGTGISLTLRQLAGLLAVHNAKRASEAVTALLEEIKAAGIEPEASSPAEVIRQVAEQVGANAGSRKKTVKKTPRKGSS